MGKINLFFIQRYFFIFFLALVPAISYSQGFKVKDFMQNMNDGSAFHAPLDAEGLPCGLVKVRSDNTELRFGGNIVGNIENIMNEYWVFLSKGSNSLVVKHPNFMSTSIDFTKYDIEVSPKATYVLTLEPIKYKEKNCLVVTTTPNDACLYVNDVFVENMSGNGLYKLYLEKGDYICRLEKKGYSKFVQAVSIGRAPQNINAELESVMAELNIKCKTTTAELYVDGEFKGTGTWKGQVFAGDHKIEAKQQNFNGSSQTISIAEKESRIFVIPELKRALGQLRIETSPSNLPIIVDGKYVGMSPCAADVETGNHYVSCKSYGLAPSRNDIKVNAGEVATLKIKMKLSSEKEWLSETYRSAYQGNGDAIKDLAEQCIAGIRIGSADADPEEAVFWLEKCTNPEEFYVDEMWISVYCDAGRPEKALEIYPIVARKNKEKGGMGLFTSLEMMHIGDAFLKKKEYDKAIQCFRISTENDEFNQGDGLEGLGDCYAAKGDKQLAANYYRKCLSFDAFSSKKRVEKKLKELGY